MASLGMSMDGCFHFDADGGRLVVSAEQQRVLTATNPKQAAAAIDGGGEEYVRKTWKAWQKQFPLLAKDRSNIAQSPFGERDAVDRRL